ncbi:hypothetical protein ACSFA7_30095 [Variovorax sp. LT1R20]|uniref:hypothetical protein n=1 Tax=Variovorax sp. LT1R20 TaxID=3443729 RepID=UPI003F4590B5
MGKKSRLKRERRNAAADIPTVDVKRERQKASSQEPRFREETAAVYGYFARYAAIDVILSLSISELWRPNRSSQVKHSLAMLVALSMQPDDFQGHRSIVTHAEFAEFLDGLKQLLPRFPMLEDFVPQADWGDVRVASAIGFKRIFYGGSVERIPDFIEAFRLLRSDHPGAAGDMNFAIALQAHIIGTIDADLVGGEDRVLAGHMEVPSRNFWSSCREALLSTRAAAQAFVAGTSEELIVGQGELKVPESLSGFSDAVMMGTVLPVLMARVDGFYLPISPRAASSVVIDLWHERINSCRVDALQDLGGRLGTFLSHRLREDDVIVGPARLVGMSHRFDRHIAAVIRSGGKLYFLLPINVGDLPKLGQIERWFKRLVDDSERWALVLAAKRQIVELRNARGILARSGGIELIAVIARVSTQPAFMEMPDTRARVISLPDFVSLFDSIKSGGELEDFWTYRDTMDSTTGGMIGLIDHFAAFRDSHGVLIEGADFPDWINLDPHWNSSWRFKELSTFWASAPYSFPDDLSTWVLSDREDGLTCMKAKGPFILAWSGNAGRCAVQAVMEVGSDPDYKNGPLLELFTHCVADAITQRSSLLEKFDVFRRNHIVIRCEMDPVKLPATDDDEATKLQASLPLLSSLRLIVDTSEKIVVAAEVNLSRLYSKLENAEDASFEAECASELTVGLSGLLALSCDEGILELLRGTQNRQPRFTLKTTQRPFDVPDYANPRLPEAGQFKLARKELAIIFKQQGVAAPARYELESAKHILNSARDAMRNELHVRIARYDQRQLLQTCVEQHDELTAKYQHEVTRIRLSLSHQVSFDRSSRLADAYEKSTSMARNYRYLLECCISSPVQGNTRPTIPEVTQLIASIDWLSVLYGASDTLHNGIDIGGIELDDSFVPTVFFSEDREEKEQQYLEEVASTRLGVGLSEGDEVSSDQDNAENWGSLDEALNADLGFSLTQMTQVLQVLSHWHSAGGDDELRFGYAAAPTSIAARVCERLPTFPVGAAEKVVKFLTLDAAGVRRLAGKQVDEPDVPIWEHSKRVHRYLIRPLVQIDHELLAWGAATADRALSIWVGSIVNGYLPAEFQWPKVAKVVREIKSGIEKQLEVRAHEIFGRHAEYVVHGIDFRRRFPKEQFDDVGDFDVLAYWPDKNLWIGVECKYNQPPFCLKDARRLRERIFGQGEDHGQFSKIERRRQFFSTNVHHLRELLQWPESQVGPDPVFREAYVCREIYWWLKHPPYEVSTEFVRVDALDGWLRAVLGIVRRAPGAPRSEIE